MSKNCSPKEVLPPASIRMPLKAGNVGLGRFSLSGCCVWSRVDHPQIKG